MSQLQGCGHLTNRIPNNFISRWLIKKANKSMELSGSVWRLKIRYRKPKKGKHYGWGGGLRRADAKRIALYLRR
jgi:hypothetical protein